MSSFIVLIFFICLGISYGLVANTNVLKRNQYSTTCQRIASPARVLSTSHPSNNKCGLSSRTLQLAESSSGDEEKKNIAQSKQGRLLKLIVFACLATRAFTTSSLIEHTALLKCALSSVVVCALALRRVEDCYSYGYGLSLIATAVISVPELCEALIVSSPSGGVIYDLKNVIKTSSLGVQTMIWAGFIHAAAYLLYGMRMVSFIFVRNKSKSFQNSKRFQTFTAKEKETPFTRRVEVWLSTSVLIGLLYALPLHLHLNKITQSLVYNIPKEVLQTTSRNGPATAIVSLVGSTLALLAIILQAVADNQKLVHKEMLVQEADRAPLVNASTSTSTYTSTSTSSSTSFSTSSSTSASVSAPTTPLPFVTKGLFRFWRHPNFLGEFLFHVGVFVAAFPAFTSWEGVLLAFMGPAVMASIIRFATTNLEKRQADTYGGKSNGAYEKWVDSTKRFF